MKMMIMSSDDINDVKYWNDSNNDIINRRY